MTRRASILLPILLAGAAGNALAESPAGWDCRYCPEYQPELDVIENGLAHSSGDPLLAPSEDAPSRPTGQQTEAWISADHRERTGEAGWIDIQLDRLGLANPSLKADFGQSPRLRWDLDYAEWVTRPGTEAKTVYSGNGSELVLPVDWQRASQTSAMPLESTLRPYRNQAQRKRLRVGADFDFATHWSSRLQLSHEERDGRGHIYGSFLTQASFLPRPIDDSTSSLSWSATYLRDRYAATLSYRLSRYNNALRSLEWDNPFSAIAEGADNGELALAPDNLSQSLDFNGSYQLNEQLRLAGAATVYRSTQDDDLLAPSANPNLQPALPRAQSDAEIDGSRAQISIDYQPSSQWRWRLNHRYWERNNTTTVDLFPQIRTDSFTSVARQNIAYDFRDHLWTLDTHYRPARQLHLKLEMEQQTRTRTQQLRRETREDRARLKIRWRAPGNLEFRLRGGWSERDGSAFESPPSGAVIENSRQRAFNLADRQRQDVALDVHWQRSDALQLGITGDWTNDDYPQSAAGLQASEQRGFQAQASGLIRTDWTWAVHAGQHHLKLRQAGTQEQSSWFANGRDLTESAGASFTRPNVLRRVDLQLGYQWTRTTSDSAVAGSAFPTLSSELHSADLRATWHWRPTVDWVWLYRYERFNEEDWQRFGLAPDSIANVIGWNADSFNEVGHLIAVSARYRF